MLLVIAAGVFGILILSRRRIPWDLLHQQERAIAAEERARMLVAELGHERAVAAIEREHAQALSALDAAGRARADALRRDPVALARALSKLSSGTGP